MNQMLLNNTELSEIKRIYGQTLIAVLRNVYGPGFANNAGNEQTLTDAFPDLDEHSLNLLLSDFQAGRLGAKLTPPGT
jgi:hypothetical protein